jgi:hypothetical protein
VTGSPLVVDYWVVNGGAIDIGIHSMAGQIIRHLLNTTQTAGAYAVNWDGKDDEGSPVYSGIYLVVVHEGSRVEMKKVLAVRE